ncbi:hypothetical protein ACFP2T_03100 [Plantactinospora solaniradicis]|uniref:Uncharacterized protein n=1 Tax=Plantactinospora solaniradicis TaxID=1723736 RepID=A0ABW1K1R5_9ACTN
MEKLSRRRLRSASVHLGALTALALTLTGCNQVGDDDDCDSRSTKPKNRSLATANPAPVGVVEARIGGGGVEPVAAVPTESGFGTHLASCGG